MKLLYITNGINGSGGLERVLSVKASALADQYGYKVHILVLNDSHLNPFYEFSPTISFHSISVGGNSPAYFQSYKKGIRSIVDKVKPDIISVCDDGLKGFFAPSLIKTNSKIIYERHVSKLIEIQSNQSWLKSLFTKLKWRIMENWAKKFDNFIVLTEGNKKEWPKLKNIEVIGNPLPFYPENISDPKSKTVICVGKISYQKGQDRLVEIWDRIYKKYPDWKLELYGKANEDFLKTDKLTGKNIFFYPPVKNIFEKYLESSIYVMPSRFEGFGMVLIEAMACGLPCVSFNCNYGPSDIIKDGKDGFLIGNGNLSEFAEKLELLISDNELRSKMGNTARQNVKRFAPDEIVSQWNDLFYSLKNSD